MKIITTTSALVFLTLASFAQNNKTDSVILITHKQLDSAARSTLFPDKPGRLLATSKEKAPYLIVVRIKPGDVEIHEQYDDVAIIRSGHGVLRTGYEVKGQRESGKAPAREWIGGTISDKRDRMVGEGDFIVIPAMMPHQYIPNAGDSLIYWTIKVKQPRK